MSCDVARLTEIARVAREALENYAKTGSDVNFKDFPHGCCGQTCDLLGRYLLANGCTSVEYVCGNRGDRSHAWLLVDGFTLDITADQFEQPSIIVEREPSWHKTYWRTEDPRPPVAVPWHEYPYGPWATMLDHFEKHSLPVPPELRS